MKKVLYLLFISLFICRVSYAQNANDIKMTFNGFGDIIYGQTWGPYANPTAAALFNKYGDPDYPTGMHNGFMSHGADFLATVNYKDNLTFQTEVNFEGERGEDGGDFEVELERMYLDYHLSDKLSFQFGYIFTPIGYINRNLYSRAWLMNSIRFYQAVSSDAGILPNHFIGGTAYGSFVLPKNNSLSYVIGYGKARDLSPSAEDFNNDLPGFQLAGNIELEMAGAHSSDFRLGLGGFYNQIHTYNVPQLGEVVDITDSSAQPLPLNEIGFNPYIHYHSKPFDLLVEYAYVAMQAPNTDDNIGTTYLNTISAEFALNCRVYKRRFAPYLRYDNITMPPNDGPYYGLRKVSDDELTRVYVPNQSVIMVGIAYDVSSFNRIKIEYERNLDGPSVENGLFFQTAFGF